MDIINTNTNYLFNLLGRNNLRFVGGAVRDYIIGKEINDIDLASTHTPDQIKNILYKNTEIKIIDSGIKFGTLTLILNGNTYQVTTLRKDISCDGRRANVAFSQKWQEDALRRDFTINALYMDIDGKIYDYFNGKDDLKNGIVKFIGTPEDRIREDYLRILRFARFSLFYGKKSIHQESFDACLKLSDQITHLSKERIASELLKIISYHNSLEAFVFLSKTNIIPIIFGCDFDIDIFKYQNKYKDDAIFKLAILLRNKTKDEIVQSLANISLSKKQLAQILSIISCYKEIKAIKQSDLTEGITLIIHKFGNDIVLKSMHIISCDGGGRDVDIQKTESFISNYQIKKLPVGGKDFMSCGVGQGENIKVLLDISLNIWIQNNQDISKSDIISLAMNKLHISNQI